MEKANSYLEKVNTNKFFIGLMMITLTIGGRFIIGELDEKKKQEITDNPTFRRFFVFCAFFMATRDIISSIALTLVFALIISVIINHDKDESDSSDDETDDENEDETTDEEEEEEEKKVKEVEGKIEITY